MSISNNRDGFERIETRNADGTVTVRHVPARKLKAVPTPPEVDLPALLKILGFTPEVEFVSICHRVGDRFTTAVMDPAAAPAHLKTLPTNADVWFGVNPVRDVPEGHKGTAADVTRLAALWADLDVAEGKCASIELAHAIVGVLSEILGTRPVVVVSTGHGLHPYWVLSDGAELSWEQAATLVRRWGRLVKSVAAEHGATADSVFNLDRILRVPGTTNNKHPESAVPAIGIRDTGRPLPTSAVSAALDVVGITEEDSDTQRSSKAMTDAELERFLDTYRGGGCGYDGCKHSVKGAVTKFNRKFREGNSRHEAVVKDVLPWAFREAMTGCYSAREAYDALQKALAKVKPEVPEWEFYRFAKWAAAQAEADPQTEKQHKTKPQGDSQRRLTWVTGSSVKPRRIEWWEPDVVMKAAINLIAARENMGKSSVASSWAARETHSGGTVLWVGTEESREHAQVPRLIAAGADMDRIGFIDVETTTIEGEVYGSALQFPLDLAPIEKAIAERGVTMIVLDPCKGLVPPEFKGNDDVAVRQYLEPIAAMCARTDVTLLGLMHFGKRESTDPGKLILGSVAWSQVARTVISIANDPDTETRILTNTKANYSPRDRSLEFTIVSAEVTTLDGPSTLGVVEWIGDTNKDARDFLSEQGRKSRDDDPDDLTELWLYEHLTLAALAGVTVTPTSAVKAAKEERNISRATLYRQLVKLTEAKLAESITEIDPATGKPVFPKKVTWQIIGAPKGDETAGSDGTTA